MFSQAAKLKEIVQKKKEKMLENSGDNNSIRHKSRARTIAIASGKGGVGKSTLTVNLAYNLARLKKKVLIIDSDIGMANLDIMLDISPIYDMGHLLRGECTLQEAIVKDPSGISILSGITGDDTFIDLNTDMMNKIINIAGEMEKDYDYLLIDLGAGAGKNIVSTILSAEELLLVLTTEPTSVMDSYSLIKILAKYNFDKSVKLVLNQVDRKKDAQKTAERMKKTVKKYLNIELDLVGQISHDRNISTAVKKQRPFSEIYAGRSAAEDFEKLAKKISGEEGEKQSKGVKSYFYKMIGFFNSSRK
ncbi:MULTISPECIES: MinD/ParA family protein [unclassified Halanaerobium]|uniref:MinD/ParA family protein n=1 Tax=unclassified Halanaerobium TaxID=2641197 RepID=UPI000DF3AB7A|nr:MULTISPECIES: MinD/ParA family protein [unclassified Halanaerobium]RCW47672.1 flagellar biosynthesis protein FlhG [Halanaerobium sp. MA284_MarDTE_T2]RCW84684.1 flagellar biosynthesis protein FlhG [Halanaerobium sp. DL-01]